MVYTYFLCKAQASFKIASFQRKQENGSKSKNNNQKNQNLKPEMVVSLPSTETLTGKSNGDDRLKE